MSEQAAYREWVSRGLGKPGKRKRQLAAALDVDPSAITRILDGTRKISLDEVPKIAAYLGETPPAGALDFYEDEEDQTPTVPLKGYVRAGAHAQYLPLNDDELDRVEAPPGYTDKTVALEVRGDSLGDHFDRWLVFFDDVRSPVTPDLLGKLCVVWVDDGRVLVKKIKKQRNGLFTLLSNYEKQDPPITDVRIESAARVKVMMQR